MRRPRDGAAVARPFSLLPSDEDRLDGLLDARRAARAAAARGSSSSRACSRTSDELATASAALNARRGSLAARARTAAFTTLRARADDVARLGDDVRRRPCSRRRAARHRCGAAAGRSRRAARAVAGRRRDARRAGPTGRAGRRSSSRSAAASTTGRRSSSPPGWPLRRLCRSGSSARRPIRAAADATPAGSSPTRRSRCQRVVGRGRPSRCWPSRPSDALVAAVAAAARRRRWHLTPLAARRASAPRAARSSATARPPTLLVHRGAAPGRARPAREPHALHVVARASLDSRLTSTALVQGDEAANGSVPPPRRHLAVVRSPSPSYSATAVDMRRRIRRRDRSQRRAGSCRPCMRRPCRRCVFQRHRLQRAAVRVFQLVDRSSMGPRLPPSGSPCSRS